MHLSHCKACVSSPNDFATPSTSWDATGRGGLAGRAVIPCAMKLNKTECLEVQCLYQVSLEGFPPPEKNGCQIVCSKSSFLPGQWVTHISRKRTFNGQ